MATTSADSPDTLPLHYSRDQLKNWIFRKLGFPVWSVELTNQQALDAIKDALDLYSQYRPRLRPKAVHMTAGTFEYFRGEDLGYGIIDVQFLEPNPMPYALYWGNLISPAPVPASGMDEYDMFLRWRKTWMRVTSARPDWYWDTEEKVLYIHNPLANYQAGAWYMLPYSDTPGLDAPGKTWVRDYALAKAMITYGEILAKFNGAIPGPVKDLSLDQQKRQLGETSKKELEEKLHNMQWNGGAGLSVD